MLGVIGGSGIYELQGLNFTEEQIVETPFGMPSAPFSIGTYGDNRGIIFLARHGISHEYLPHEVNYRANIWALKSLGVTQIIGISAVGSLREELKPGDICIPDQYFDFVKGSREKSFFGGGLIAHVSTAEPSCAALTNALRASGDDMAIPVHTGVTYACVDGPRLGTRAESLFLKNAAACDLVGMTNVPEAFLAREAQICYCTISIVTDYDCWLDDPTQHVSVEQVISRYGASLEKAKRLLGHFLKRTYNVEKECSCRQSLTSAILSKTSILSRKNKALLDLLKR